VVHVWYVDLLEEIVTAIRATGLPFRVVLTVPTEREDAVRHELSRLSFEAELFVSPNRGRDILPFLKVAARLREEGEDVVLKLHTKRSTHRDNGALWRAELLERLVAPLRATAIASAFRAQPELGVVAAEGHVQPLASFMGANAGNLAYLCSLAGVAQPSGPSARFVAGSMFWCRLSALTPLIDAPLTESEFAHEAAQVDGTMAHAIERAVSLSASSLGFRTATAASIVGDPERDGPYPYAQRS
jgi:lipopolysaccharide biosynthesis protein